MTPWLLSVLACPRDHQGLTLDGGVLCCPSGHTYAVVDGIPILLLDDVDHPHWVAMESLAAARGTVLEDPPGDPGPIDVYVQEAIGATGGYMYESVRHRLREYPIPALPLPAGGGRPLLDVGSNWGRWTFAAARKGYRAVGVDPYFVAIRAARRVCRQLGLEAEFVVGDARYLPFKSDAFDTVFSYSVLQHFAKPDARQAFAEAGRVLVPGGTAMIQIANAFGIRSLYHQAKRRFRRPEAFQVRYWTGGELRRAVAESVGPARISIDGFLSLNAQPAEAHLLARRFQVIIWLSELLKRVSGAAPWLVTFADSLYVRATRRAG